MKLAQDMSRSCWEGCLSETFRLVSETPKCKAILSDIGELKLQLIVADRPEMSYWEEYAGGRVTPHLGVCADCTAQIETTFPVLLATLLNRVSIMEAAADEAYELRGDTAALMKCANILPYVMTAFSQTLASRVPDIAEVSA
jgi:hypothetical protein